MNDIEQQALQTYQKNLNYFQEYHPSLFKKISTFEAAINQSVYQEHYSLEYTTDKYFDIKEVETNNWLYGIDSEKHSIELLNSVNLKRTDTVFEAQLRFSIKEEELEEMGQIDNFHSSLWATANIIHYNSKVAQKNNSEMKQLYKFIFLGTGLGIHIPKIIEQYSIYAAFILEHDLELFRSSLFITDYAEAFKNTKPYFSIAENYADMQTTFLAFLNNFMNYNLYIKFLPFSTNYQDDLKSLESITLSQDHISYPYQGYMARSFKAAKKVANGKCFLNISKTYLSTLLSESPILILASGPSLQKNIAWVRNNKEKFITVAVLSSCKYLLENDIQPNIVIHIDPQQISTKLLDGINMQSFENSLIVFGSSVHDDLVEQFDPKKVFFFEEATDFKVDHGFFALPTIGEYAAILPLLLGAKNLYLLGLDLSLDPTSMKDHIDSHINNKEFAHNSDEEHVQFSNSICYVKGNFLETVPSRVTYRLSITQFTAALAIYKQATHNIYNLSNGAYLEHTTPLFIEAFNTNDLQTLEQNLFQEELGLFFSSISSCQFSDKDKKYMQKQLQVALNILNQCKKLRKVNVTEIDTYLFQKIVPFMETICEMNSEKKSDLGEIFFEYFKITSSFIFDTFNIKDLQDAKKHVKYMDKIVLDAVEKIASTYYNTIKGYM